MTLNSWFSLHLNLSLFVFVWISAHLFALGNGLKYSCSIHDAWISSFQSICMCACSVLFNTFFISVIYSSTGTCKKKKKNGKKKEKLYNYVYILCTYLCDGPILKHGDVVGFLCPIIEFSLIHHPFHPVWHFINNTVYFL